MLKIYSIRVLKATNYIHVLECDISHTIAIIDPGFEDIDKFLQDHNLNPDYILLTHNHEDHYGAVPYLVKKYQSIVIAPFLSEHFVVQQLISHGDRIQIGQTFLEVIKAVGHSPHHVVYYDANQSSLFVGDTLFYLGCGRAFFSMEKLYTTLQRIKTFPTNTTLFYGHEYALPNTLFSQQYSDSIALADDINYLQQGGSYAKSSLQFNLSYNPFLTAKTFGQFQERRLKKDIFFPSLKILQNQEQPNSV